MSLGAQMAQAPEDLKKIEALEKKLQVCGLPLMDRLCDCSDEVWWLLVEKGQVGWGA
jgi:hypothetical protein